MAAGHRGKNLSERNDPSAHPSAVLESNINDTADELAINQLSLNELSMNELATRESPTTNELTVNEPTVNELAANKPTTGAALSRSSASEQRPLRHARTDGSTLLALYHFGWSAIYLVGALVMAIPTMITGIVGLAEDPEMFFVTALLGAATFFILGLSLLFFAVGFGLWRLRQWARTAAIAIAFVSLPTVIGTIPAALTLWYLFKDEVSSIFR